MILSIAMVIALIVVGMLYCGGLQSLIIPVACLLWIAINLGMYVFMFNAVYDIPAMYGLSDTKPNKTLLKLAMPVGIALLIQIIAAVISKEWASIIILFTGPTILVGSILIIKDPMGNLKINLKAGILKIIHLIRVRNEP